MTTVACIIIASERRKDLVRDRVLPSILNQGFDETLVVGDWMMSDVQPEPGFATVRYACVEPLRHDTVDALVKRDVGTIMTHAAVLVYLCDDHALGPNFLATLREVIDEEWDVVVPNRYTVRDNQKIFALNNGERDGYCGGHAGIFRRELVESRPWSAHSHSKYWDARISYSQRLAGARFVWHPRAGIAVEDIEPGAEPWK